ncbi:hypothetical protein MNV49_004546 [Pseudohyphozyma bogoriensis]|nr:hypothetical protein MNV49_004546 [Pseudohyphozyma bogoriensis]
MGKYAGRSWMDHLEGLDPEGMAPASMWAQSFITEWQNPPIEDCDKYQFFSMHLAHGLGSTVHFLSQSLQIALEDSRILTWGTPNTFGSVFVDPSCTPSGINSLDCIYEPLTHCPRSAMRENNTVDVTLYELVTSFPGEYTARKAPRVMEERLRKVLPYEMAPQAMKYWWRGQTAAYIMRLNPSSLSYIASRRLNQSLHNAFTLPTSSISDPPPSLQPLPMPFPLHPGTISMHVRHGDKSSEMSLHPLSSYVEKAEELVSLNPFAYAKMGFVSSEDPVVVEETKGISDVLGRTTTASGNWRWFTSELGRINSSPFDQLHSFGNKTETTLGWMSELMLALECDAFVGTRGSNWNRVIDELRCIWLDKCRHPYVEVGAEEDWFEYSW